MQGVGALAHLVADDLGSCVGPRAAHGGEAHGVRVVVHDHRQTKVCDLWQLLSTTDCARMHDLEPRGRLVTGQQQILGLLLRVLPVRRRAHRAHMFATVLP